MIGAKKNLHFGKIKPIFYHYCYKRCSRIKLLQTIEERSFKNITLESPSSHIKLQIFPDSHTFALNLTCVHPLTRLQVIYHRTDIIIKDKKRKRERKAQATKKKQSPSSQNRAEIRYTAGKTNNQSPK